VKYELKLNHHELIVARRNLGGVLDDPEAPRLALHLGKPTTLDLILGATSISGATRLDNANRLERRQPVHEVDFKQTVQRTARPRNQRLRSAAAERRAIRRRRSSPAPATPLDRAIVQLEAQAAERRPRRRSGADRAAQAHRRTPLEHGRRDHRLNRRPPRPTQQSGRLDRDVYLGVPYVWGGASPGGFDLRARMYAFAQIESPSSYAMANMDRTCHTTPGDLVFFDGDGVGMYIGGGYVNGAARRRELAAWAAALRRSPASPTTLPRWANPTAVSCRKA
jgi:cell wall-associated NlpC family hydrolase